MSDEVPEAERQTLSRVGILELLESGGMFDGIELLNLSTHETGGSIQYIGYDWFESNGRWMVTGDWDEETTSFSIYKLD